MMPWSKREEAVLEALPMFYLHMNADMQIR